MSGRRSAGLACRSYLLQPCTESGCVALLDWCAAVALQSNCAPRGWRSDDFAMRLGSLCGCTDEFGASSEWADETRCDLRLSQVRLRRTPNLYNPKSGHQFLLLQLKGRWAGCTNLQVIDVAYA